MKVSVLIQHSTLCWLSPKVNITTLLMEGGARWPVHPCVRTSPARGEVLRCTKTKALVLKLKTSCTQESSQLLLDIFSF